MWNTSCHLLDTGALTSGHVTASALLATVRRRRAPGASPCRLCQDVAAIVALPRTKPPS